MLLYNSLSVLQRSFRDVFRNNITKVLECPYCRSEIKLVSPNILNNNATFVYKCGYKYTKDYTSGEKTIINTCILLDSFVV